MHTVNNMLVFIKSLIVVNTSLIVIGKYINLNQIHIKQKGK